MNSLIIDCSSGMSVYLIKNDVIDSYVNNDQKKHTDELLVTVDMMLKKSNITIDEIDNIGVCVGPGSFTGIRVAISICKGLAVGKNINVVAIKNFDIYSVEESNKYCLILDGFSKYVYVRLFNNGNVKEDCMLIDELVSLLKNEKFDIFVQNEKVQKLLNNYEISSNIAQNEINLHFLSKLSNKEFIQLNQISPVYLRASQAEIELKNKNK